MKFVGNYKRFSEKTKLNVSGRRNRRRLRNFELLKNTEGHVPRPSFAISSEGRQDNVVENGTSRP